MTAGALLSVATTLTRAHYPQTTTEPATAWMRAADELFSHEMPWVLLACALVLGLLVALAVRLRGRDAAGAGTTPETKPGPFAILWTLAPWVLVALVALPAVMAALHAPPPPTAALRVNVIGHQWWWEFKYPESGVVTATDLHVPVGRPVHLVIESADVMHSLWVPAVGPRQDVWPLRRREFTFTPDRAGMFPGQCAELCGMSHAHMD